MDITIIIRVIYIAAKLFLDTTWLFESTCLLLRLSKDLCSLHQA